jgi:hypothetical protein
MLLLEARPVRKADNLTAIYEPIIKVMWEPQRLTTLWASRPATGIALLTYLCDNLLFILPKNRCHKFLSFCSVPLHAYRIDYPAVESIVPLILIKMSI